MDGDAALGGARLTRPMIPPGCATSTARPRARQRPGAGRPFCPKRATRSSDRRAGPAGGDVDELATGSPSADDSAPASGKARRELGTPRVDQHQGGGPVADRLEHQEAISRRRRDVNADHSAGREKSFCGRPISSSAPGRRSQAKSAASPLSVATMKSSRPSARKCTCCGSPPLETRRARDGAGNEST